jgi:hypothetical protein
MPENEEAVDVRWLVRVAGCDEDLLVDAARVVYHPATSTATVHAIGESREHLLVTFKNADHEIVFQAQATAVVYMLRVSADRTDLAPR